MPNPRRLGVGNDLLRLHRKGLGLMASLVVQIFHARRGLKRTLAGALLTLCTLVAGPARGEPFDPRWTGHAVATDDAGENAVVPSLVFQPASRPPTSGTLPRLARGKMRLADAGRAIPKHVIPIAPDPPPIYGHDGVKGQVAGGSSRDSLNHREGDKR